MAKFLAANWRDLKNPDAGGAEVHLHEILKRLVTNGHEVTLFTTKFAGGSEEDVDDGVRIIRKGDWYNANYVLPFHIRSFLKKNPVDLVIDDINKIPFLLPLVTDIKVLGVIPHLFGTTVFRETNLLFGSYVYFWERLIPFAYRKSRFVVISPSTRDDLIERGIPGERIDVVLCGVDHSTYRRLDLERYEKPTIVHFGRMRKYKSIGIVVRAFDIIKREIPDARLIIIGGGPEKQSIVDLVGKMGLRDSVEFPGTVSTEDLVRVLNQAHLFLNASPKEGWGLTVVEANACGMPGIGSDRPGLLDSILDKKTGYLVEYGDHEGFARRSLELLQDKAKWREMSNAALEWARSLTWERTASEMENIFLREIG